MKALRAVLSAISCAVLAVAAMDSPARGGEKAKRLTVSDYFAMVPAGTMETTGANLLKRIRAAKSGVEDAANGYLSCGGDGAQSSFEVALFRYKDDRPLLAICQGQDDEGGPKSVRLDFFQLDESGALVNAPRSIFPVRENTFPLRERAAHSYVLPRRGRTVLVRDLASGEVKQRFTWNGERFVEQK
jgi:hypothetical protein